MRGNLSKRKPKRNPERIDFTVNPEGNVIVQRFWRINGTYKPLVQEVKETGGGKFNLDNALEWLEDHGYRVLRWGGIRDPRFPLLWPGARAMRKLEPIRTRYQIHKFRQQVEETVMEYLSEKPDAPTPGWTFHDLAYYL